MLNLLNDNWLLHVGLASTESKVVLLWFWVLASLSGQMAMSLVFLLFACLFKIVIWVIGL